MGFCALGLGFMKKNRKMGMGFQFEKQAGIVGFELGFEKTISWEMGLGPPFTTLLTVFAIRTDDEVK